MTQFRRGVSSKWFRAFERFLERVQRPSSSRFHGAEWYAFTRSDLRIGKPFEEGDLQGGTLSTW